MAVQLAPGSLFSARYRVIKPLGHGGMSTVYEVCHEATGAYRALKLMLPQLATEPRFLRRFEQESRIGARIESDHIVEVIDAGVDFDSGLPYLLMERLTGEPLSVYVYRKGRLTRGELGAIFAQLGHALEAAHRVGVIHRDLKPENIFLARARRDGVPFTVKVLDFGIAKILADTHNTATMMLGSPLWVAPEQTDTERSVGPYTDIWALGLLAFYCLTGKSFWLRANEPGFSIPRLMRELLFDPLPSASERAAALTGEPLTIPGFDAWFARCVVREEQARFASVTEARDALLKLLSHGQRGPAIEVEPPVLWDSEGDAPLASSPLPLSPTVPRRRVPAQRPRGPLALALGLGVPAGLAALGLGVFLWHHSPTSDAALAASAPAANRRITTLSAPGGATAAPPAAQPPSPQAASPQAAPLAATQAAATQAAAPQPGARQPADLPPAAPPPADPLPAAPALALAAPEPAPTFTLDLRDLPSSSAASRAAAAPTTPKTPAPASRPRPTEDRPASASALAPGFLSLVCVPSCDGVVVRGRNLGPSPILREPFEPGAYTVQLRREGAPSVSRTVVIQSGAATSLRVRLDSPDAAKGRGLPNL